VGASGRSAELRGDTIAALATAPGRGAVALVRLSGTRAADIAARVGVGTLTPRRMTRVRLHACDAPDDPLDDALATWFPAPRSFTGEDLLEFSAHGGALVSATLLAALVTAGARPALAGEFAERAVRHGKLDLLQAEALADLIDARSRAMQRTALLQLSGALSHRLAALRSALLDVEALIAYELDFPEEDDGPVPRADAVRAATQVITALDALAATLPAAELGRDGVSVVLAGAPNAGKSSLFNALIGARRAIVSEIPGTTRDALDVLVEHDPWPLRLIDTAGLRSSADALERLGIEVSTDRLAAAHVVLVCGDDDDSLLASTQAIAVLSPAPRIAVRTKRDLLDTSAPWSPSEALRAVTHAAVAVSATTGEGLDAVRAVITNAVRTAHPDPAEELPVVTRARHVSALVLARNEVEQFRAAWERAELPGPVAATHLRAAVHALDELLGGIDVDEVLERVFRTFCIGK
jgi:tRNA modification GTPase